MDNHASAASSGRAEAERLLGIADKLLFTRDLTGAREFALLAQETEPLLEGSDQILAISDVILASERPVSNSRHLDWYAILQSDSRSDADLLKKNYRRLALLLHPDKNKFPLADSAFKLVADAWATLSNPSKRTPYDHEISLFSKVDLRHQPPPPQPRQPPDKDKLPVRRSPRGSGGASNPTAATTAGTRSREEQIVSFWTACPYCYVLYEYPRAYEECCLRCRNCERAFHGAPIPSLPPMVPGKEAYYCCWGFFPLGFSLSKVKEVDVNVTDDHVHTNYHVNTNNNTSNSNDNPNSGFPNWMPGMFTPPVAAAAAAQLQGQRLNVNAAAGSVDISDGSGSGRLGNNTGDFSGRFRNAPPEMSKPGAKKRGRPRKNPFPV